MKRKEAIGHMAKVVEAVLCAKDKIKGEWEYKFRSALTMSEEELRQLAHDYFHAIAEEIMRDTTDEEIEELYGHD
jgi:hypothetical protein